VRKAPAWWDGTPPAWLAPLSSGYALAGKIRRTLVRPLKLPVPVICIGNIVAGGAGKTPVVIALANMLKAQGYAPHILTRGYGGAVKQHTRVNADHRANEVGDEALLLAAHAPCWVGANRRVTARLACDAGANILIMDDGFQNPTLHKDLSFLVIDGGYGMGNGAVIPAGCLREPPADAFARAQAVVLVGKDAHGIIPTLPKHLTLLRGAIQPTIPESLKAQKLLAFCGIGRPKKFYDTLIGAGLNVAETQDFPDHHPFSEAELQSLQACAEAVNATLVTTEKDWVRLGALWREKITYVPITLKLEPASLLQGLLTKYIPQLDQHQHYRYQLMQAGKGDGDHTQQRGNP
jgi:tetraacyldisaccharide 4'-kinase